MQKAMQSVAKYPQDTLDLRQKLSPQAGVDHGFANLSEQERPSTRVPVPVDASKWASFVEPGSAPDHRTKRRCAETASRAGKLGYQLNIQLLAAAPNPLPVTV